MTEICAACLALHPTHADSRCSPRSDSEGRPLRFVSACTRPPRCCVPEGGHEVAGGPAHDEAPLWVCAPLTHFLYAVGHPHLTHSDLGLHLKMGGRSTGDNEAKLFKPLIFSQEIDQKHPLGFRIQSMSRCFQANVANILNQISGGAELVVRSSLFFPICVVTYGR